MCAYIVDCQLITDKTAAVCIYTSLFIDSGGVLDIRAILSLLSIPAVAYVVTLKTVMGIPAGVFQSMFTVVNIERLGLTPEINGQLLSYLGFITMVCIM